MPIKDRQQKKIDLIWSTWVDQRMDDTGCGKVVPDFACTFLRNFWQDGKATIWQQINFEILYWTSAVKKIFMRDVYPRGCWSDVHKILWFLLPHPCTHPFFIGNLALLYLFYNALPSSGRHSRIVPLIAHAWPARLRLHNREEKKEIAFFFSLGVNWEFTS